MTRFRDLLTQLEASGELVTVNRQVEARYELAALLKQAEERRKAIRFNAVDSSSFPVVGGILTTPQRMAQGLGRSDAQSFTRAQHSDLVCTSMNNPIASVEVDNAACQEIVATGDDIDCDRLPVPTCFAEDTGPFLTAAVGIARNPDNGILNVGMYRIQMLDDNQVVVSASPTSGLFGFFGAAAEQGKTTPVALVLGADPAVTMAAAAKIPADISELDVAGALNGEPLELVCAVDSDLLVPANAEIVLEVQVDHTNHLVNRMGEFGDFYGEQSAPVAKVTALTHRKDAIFHTIMAGAGREHNSIGLIILSAIEPDLRQQLTEKFAAVADVRVYFEPPRMGVVGDVYIKLHQDTDCDVNKLIHDTFATRCANFDIARMIRRIIVVDHDINIRNRREVDWAISVRVTRAEQILLLNDLPAADSALRLGINATENSDEKDKFRRPSIPGGEGIRLDDYLS